MLFYRTELGYSRAWIRLALEQKQLAGHLTTMLRDLPLIRSHYKRYAFLRYGIIIDYKRYAFLRYSSTWCIGPASLFVLC